MKGIADAVDLSLIIDGSILVKPYQASSMSTLNAIQLWDYLGLNQHRQIKFGDESWCASGNKSSVTFYDASPKLAYQLKALALGMHTQGIREGGRPLSWKTTGHLISNLKRFGCFVAKYGMNGLDELNDINELKMRHIIREMIVSMEMNKHPSTAVAILKTMYWVRAYQLIVNPAVHVLMIEYLRPFNALKKQRQNKHAIIPPRVLENILSESEFQVEKARQMFEPWCEIQLKLNRAISILPVGYFRKSTFIDILTDIEKSELAKYHYTINRLRRYVYALILSYTGMRFNEVIALPDDGAIAINGEYYLKTLLSKTTDEPQYLEWVTNKTTYDAVILLSNINQIYRERAELLLTHHADTLSDGRRINMQYGLKNREIFNVQHHKQSCQFTQNGESHSDGFSNLNNIFNISVTAEDIEHLNQMNCNYHSVTHNHQGFRSPYKVGDIFNLSDHMFRHTFAWFIIANRLGTLGDIKYQFKHAEDSMTLVYSQRGFETMEELINLIDSFSEFMISQSMTDMVQAAEDGVLAGKGGQGFMTRMSEILNDDLSTTNFPHFSNMEEILNFTAKHSSNFRGLSHGYCTKGRECKVRNSADPSHCVNCSSYIATPRHLPHWIVIKRRCEAQLQAFEKLPDEMRLRYLSFSTALTDNLNAANSIINQLTINEKKA